MTRADELRRLTALTRLILDARLAELRRAADARAASEARLAGLGQPAGQAAGLQGATAHLASLAYQRWADARRAEINRQLARQTAEWLEATDRARSAFGRDQVLGRLAGRDGRD